MDKIKVEYIVVIDTQDGFCSTIQAFNNYLESNADIQIINKGKCIKFKELEIAYDVLLDNVVDPHFKSFHTKFICNNVGGIEVFSSFLKVIRGLLITASGKKPVSLWDDISLYYSQQAYPKINEIENLMRKLLTKFSVTKLGSKWIDENIPEEIKSSVKKKEKEMFSNEADYLYQTDFKDLTTFLSGKIKTPDIKELHENINNASKIEDLDLNHLKSFIPTNNWNKYFSKVVKIEWKDFETKWLNLYKLRCKVAHNNFINKNDYNEIVQLTTKLREPLEMAISELDKIDLSPDDFNHLTDAFSERSFYLEVKFQEKMLSIYALFKKLANQQDNLYLDLFDDDNMEVAMYLIGKGVLPSSILSELYALIGMEKIIKSGHGKASSNDIERCIWDAEVFMHQLSNFLKQEDIK
ncbi:hypothetical protein MYP_702 [Sporocytophaga myxococcoides]|uniref:Uncharacterized protein n=1 Tax=Sporocytophaga myxococcoides TaxID=153721 RepID=A0A098L9B0_9BACT|nr:HEPN domain-containing protein [Sporocytophaga myxococcoides]GAL83475.1 hypothetical protein MYP_702 [Sporocytophaga myxococcoides]